MLTSFLFLCRVVQQKVRNNVKIERNIFFYFKEERHIDMWSFLVNICDLFYFKILIVNVNRRKVF